MQAICLTYADHFELHIETVTRFGDEIPSETCRNSKKIQFLGAIKFPEKFATQVKSALLAALAPTAHVFRIQNGAPDCSQL